MSRTLAEALSQAGNDLEAAKAAAKKLKMRRFTWCRIEHVMLDDVRWRLVARMSGAPQHMIEAFVVRLDIFASANKPRGSLDGFNLAALAAHWNLASGDQLARIYAALEHPDVGWIDQEYVVTFWDRNPDTEDEGAALRQRRSRIRRRIPAKLAKLARVGRIDQARRNEIEATLGDLEDDDLFALESDLKRELGSMRAAAKANYPLSRVTPRDTVTVTARSDQINKTSKQLSEQASGVGPGLEPNGSAALQNPVHTDSGESGDIHPELWLATAGAEIVTRRCGVTRPRAEHMLHEWGKQIAHDLAGLKAILAAADLLGVRGGIFGDRVRQEISRYAAAARGPQLPLLSPIKGDRHG